MRITTSNPKHRKRGVVINNRYIVVEVPNSQKIRVIALSVFKPIRWLQIIYYNI